MYDQFLLEDQIVSPVTLSDPPTPVSTLTVTSSKMSDGSTLFAFSNGAQVLANGVNLSLNLDTVISSEPSDDWILLEAVDFAVSHTRLDTNTEQGRLALIHMQSEVAQLYIKVQLSNDVFQMPGAPGLSPQGSLVSWQLSDILNRTMWVINDSAGQPGGVGRNIQHSDGTFDANFTSQGFESYYSQGDTFTNYVLLHELAHESPAGLNAQAFFDAAYVARTLDNNFTNYGPDQSEWVDREVYANLMAQEFAEELNLAIISNPTYGYIF